MFRAGNESETHVTRAGPRIVPASLGSKPPLPYPSHVVRKLARAPSEKSEQQRLSEKLKHYSLLAGYAATDVKICIKVTIAAKVKNSVPFFSVLLA